MYQIKLVKNKKFLAVTLYIHMYLTLMHVYVLIVFVSKHSTGKKQKKNFGIEAHDTSLNMEYMYILWSGAYTLIICQHMCKHVCLPFHLAFAILIHRVATAQFKLNLIQNMRFIFVFQQTIIVSVLYKH